MKQSDDVYFLARMPPICILNTHAYRLAEQSRASIPHSEASPTSSKLGIYQLDKSNLQGIAPTIGSIRCQYHGPLLASGIIALIASSSRQHLNQPSVTATAISTSKLSSQTLSK